MLNLPDEVIEIILDYLPVNDLLNASTVSKKWHQYIGESASFRKKIVINSNFYTKSEISANRKYESLNIRQFEVNSAVTKLIKNHEWHTVYFNVQKVSSQKTFVEIIERLKQVRDLKVMNVAITKLKSHKKISLPELENLTFSDVAVDTFETFLSRQPSLKSLSLRFLTTDILNNRTVGEYVVEFLILNSHIRELELYADVSNELFKSEIAQIVSLNLRSLSLNFCNTASNAMIRKNIEDFLKSQENSLDDLKILFQQKFVDRRGFRHHWYFEDEESDENEQEECNDISIVFSAWNNLSNLKKLTLRFFVNFVENHTYLSIPKTLKINNNIMILNIKHIGCTIPAKTIEKIFMLCPNMKSLYISTINPQIIAFCSQNLKLLRSISYSIENDDAINAYNTIAASADANFNKFITFRKEYKG